MDATGASTWRGPRAAQARTVCSSALASAFNCGPATTIYGLGLIGIIGAVVLMIIGIVLRPSRHQARPGTAKPAAAPS